LVAQASLNRLVKEAARARNNAYSPYSGVKIGAAVLTKKGAIYSGCNVENSSYSLSNCAERTAIFKAVSDGDNSIVAIAVVGEGEEFTKPCGACRQVMIQFNPKMKVLLRGADGFSTDKTAEELLPVAFNPAGLKRK
jgi:cytidine deaminase